MKIRPLTVLLSLCLGSIACSDEGPAFVPLDQLCLQHAQNICSARAACCEQAPSSAECEVTERSSCEALRSERVDDGSLDYDSERAAQVRAEELAALESCGAPFSVGRYFEGLAALGDGCESDAQCESDRCDLEQSVCVSNDQLLLCPAAESSE